jgi:hypothetical protein
MSRILGGPTCAFHRSRSCLTESINLKLIAHVLHSSSSKSSQMQTHVVEFHDEPILQFSVHQTRTAAGRMFWVRVLPNTAAEAAGVATGDVILRVNGQHIGGWHFRDLFNALFADLPVVVEFGVAVSARSCVSPFSISEPNVLRIHATLQGVHLHHVRMQNIQRRRHRPPSPVMQLLCVCCFASSHLSSHVRPCRMQRESPSLKPLQLSVHRYALLHCFCFT